MYSKYLKWILFPYCIYEMGATDDQFLQNYMVKVRVRVVFNTTYNNISAISWLSVLLVEDAIVPGENHRPVGSR